MEGQLPPDKAATRPKERPFRGIRMRKWGKWVAEIREPNKRSRIWLGSYCTPVAAAKAYDTALFYLRGRTARLNFPDDISIDDRGTTTHMSAASIRKKAAENPDLNQAPTPDTSDDNWCRSEKEETFIGCE
ncbi:hypothetical protein MUK42_33938 [Musa troglodytarum]|uniref:AP2/ERF domain-containing protein n=1 Tax=Musa troglodytarum TaxID=320322 RepID=A0A9E7JCN7_9LILI|nr:hypothetical protein MUK42_26483 [Musa troglodytarum]URD76503.1 hypothetical protein MUK42_33938 [Musa troglodytarum]